MLAAISIGCVGAIASVALPIAIGIFIGRRKRAVSHIAGYTALFGLAGSAPLMAVMVASVDQADPIAGLSTTLSVAYPLMAGIGLFAFAFITGILARKR